MNPCNSIYYSWGHASENPRLPNTLKQKGIKFIGPTGPVMSVLGDKIAANILAQTAKVPSIPWSGTHAHATLTYDVSTCLGAQPAVPHPSPVTDRVDVHTLTYPPPHHPAFPPQKNKPQATA